MDVVELTRELVQIPSVTNEEGKVCEHVRDRLAESGWHVSTQVVPPEDEVSPNFKDSPRLNVLAKSRPDSTPRVVLTTHLDTVPPFIDLSEDEEHLFGRGTCDAKGIFAAQWVAAERLREGGHDDIALLGVVGEETDSLGAKMVKQLLPKADYLVNGEPTELVMASGAKGILSLALRWKGVPGHSAYPEVGLSAAHAMIQALDRLLGAELPYEERFGKTTVNVGLLSGGVAPNVIAPHAEALVMIRLGAEKEKVLSEVKHLLGEEVHLEVRSWSQPHEILVPEGLPAAIVRFGSDIPYLSEIGRCLMVGPGSIHDAHTRNEKVKKRDLQLAVELYVRVAESLLDRRVDSRLQNES